MPTRYFCRRWDETRGDEFDEWGPSTWYFEVDAEGWPIRQIEMYDNGPTLRYGPAAHDEDQFGGLAEASLYDSDEDWAPHRITSAAFERVWASAGK